MNAEIRIKKASFSNTIMQYIFLYLVYISHGAVIYNLNEEQITNVIIVVCIGYILFHRKLHRNYYIIHTIVFFILMLGLMLIHSQPYFLKVSLRIIESILVLIVAWWIDREKFAPRFVNITLFFAILSLIFYIIQIVNPYFLMKIFQIQNGVIGWEGNDFYGKWFYTYRGRYALYRNNGIFSEPGLYQMILNAVLAAMLFFPKLFSLKRRQYLLSLMIIITTLVTTSSTTGYMGLVIIIIGYLMKRNESFYSKGIKKYAIFILLTVVIMGFCDYYVRGNSSVLYINVISKFEDIGVLENASGGARLSVIEICMGLFSKRPSGILLGFGYTNVARAMSLSGAKTSGAFIVYFLAAAGLPITVYLLYPYVFRTIWNKNRIVESIVFIFLYFNTSLAQSKEIYPALIIYPFLLLCEKNRK